MRTRYSAAREVVEKSQETIDRETALKWQARALACYEQYRKTRLGRWLIKAEHFRDEALEHAALGGDFGRLVAKIERKLDEARRASHRKASKVSSTKFGKMPLSEARVLYRKTTKPKRSGRK